MEEIVSKKIICINIGSRSKKYTVYLDDMIDAHFESELSNSNILGNLKSLGDSDCIFVFRIVAPGEFFTEDRVIDQEFVSSLSEISYLSPIHANATIDEIEFIRKKVPNAVMLAISDSKFHKDIPEIAYTYAIPKSIASKHSIRKQGYHGLSIQSCLNKLEVLLPSIPEKVILCHLGGGTSVTAIRRGKSIDTSMGWTPIDGVPMAERSGSIDPSVVILLSKELGISGEDLSQYLSKSCGLEALSEIEGGDMHKIIEERRKGNRDANFAYNLYIYSLRKYIGAMYSVMSGCDCLILSGTIAEKSPDIRRSLLEDLSCFGFSLDEEKNRSAAEVGDYAYLDKFETKTIVVIKPDETEEMFKSAKHLIARRH